MQVAPVDLVVPWRERLGSLLARVLAALCCVVLIPILLGTFSSRIRVELSAVTAALFVGFVALARQATPQRVRSIGLVSAFIVIGAAGYATVGFLSAPGVAFAAAVVLSALLAGRRAMLVTIGMVCLVGGAIAALMVHGVLAPPPAVDISPTLAAPWLRSMGITLLLISVFGVTATHVVEQIERAKQGAETEARRRREVELQVLHAQSTELTALLAGSLAHDVNNALMVIVSSSAALTDRDATTAERQEAAEAMDASVSHAASLTRRLLTLGRRDAPAAEIIRLSTFVAADEAMLRALAPAEIEIELSLDGDAYCELDPIQLHQVLLNLAVNARDAMPAGGRLAVSVQQRSASAGRGIRGPIPAGDWVVLAVEDDGVGMDAETRQRAFEPFFKTKEIGKGSGLGLATLPPIIEASGGHIALDSVLGRGTRIEIWLPAVDAPAHTVKSAAAR